VQCGTWAEVPGWPRTGAISRLDLLATVLVLVAGFVQLAGDDGLHRLAVSSVISLISGVHDALGTDRPRSWRASAS
jgi:hypothetical protein